MDGHRTLVELRRLQPDLRVILCSGYDARKAAGRFPAGPTGYLQKPFELSELVAKVKQALEA
jgi:CheY-like chemotaxis protein